MTKFIGMKLALYTLLIFGSFFTAKAQQAYSISGTVRDEKGALVPGATVFLSGSKKITATDGKGEFHLDGLPSGTYELAVKMLGFFPLTRNVLIQQQSVRLDISLKTDAVALNEVVIKGRSKEPPDPNRGKYLALFTQYFFGRLNNASRCTIINPDVLKFHVDQDGALEASTSEFLVIENAALGYRINYLLRSFKLDLAHFTLAYQGSSNFEEMKASPAQQKRWEVNRQLTYEGSAMHFFRTLFTNSTQAEGFLIFCFPDGRDINREMSKAELAAIEPLDPASLFLTVNKDFKVLQTTWGLHIVYLRENEPYWFSTMGEHIAFPIRLPSKKTQVSLLRPLVPGVQVDRNGGFPPASFMFNGYWSLEGVADLLPMDYVSNSTITNPEPANSSPLQPQDIKDLTAAVDTFRSRMPVEKVHLHFDKPYYATGDTMWMKAYVVNGENNEPSAISGNLYVDLINEQDSVKRSLLLPVSEGFASGDIVLPANLPEGNYRIRAYTNWMRNFDEEFFFDKAVPIGNALSNNVITIARYSFSKTGETATVNADISYATLEGAPIADKEVNYEVQADSRTVTKGKAVTDSGGGIKISFNSDGPARIITTLKPDNKQTVIKTIPVSSASAGADVQFFPESGQLVENITSKVALKAVGADGLGAEISGYIADKDNKKVADFHTEHAGMGTFLFTPLAGNTYRAVVQFADGSEKNMELPKATPARYVLAIDNSAQDSIKIRISVSPQVLRQSPEILLIERTNNVIHYAAKTKLQFFTLNATLPKERFPSGIAQFTLLAGGLPVAERLAFIRHPDEELNISVSTDKPSYSLREKVNMNVSVADLSSKADLSVAVTDMSKVPVDENAETTLLSNLLLTSDLKGYIEKPNYYFTDPSAEKAGQLDNLMLTQGWRRFDPLREPAMPPLSYKPEQAMVISGKVLAGTRPVKNGKVTLFATGRGSFLLDTLTDAEGRFTFDRLAFADSTRFVLQARTEKGGTDVKIELDSIPRQIVGHSNKLGDRRDNVNSSILPYLKNSKEQFEEFDKYGILKKGILLNEVTITGRKNIVFGNKEVVENSSSLNLPGHYDYLLKQKDVEAFPNLGYALQGKIPGIIIMDDPATLTTTAHLASNRVLTSSITPLPMIVYIDGVDMGNDLSVRNVNPSEIATVEVLTSGANSALYGGNSAGGVIVITTKKGGSQADAVKQAAPGVRRLNPKGYYISRQFYSPVYTPEKNSPMTDLRSTIYWNPDIIPGADGKAKLEFFTADKPGTYRAVVEGLDYAGRPGRQVFMFTVK